MSKGIWVVISAVLLMFVVALAIAFFSVKGDLNDKSSLYDMLKEDYELKTEKYNLQVERSEAKIKKLESDLLLTNIDIKETAIALASARNGYESDKRKIDQYKAQIRNIKELRNAARTKEYSPEELDAQLTYILSK